MVRGFSVFWAALFSFLMFASGLICSDSEIKVNTLVPLWKYAAGGELVSPPAVTDNIYLYSQDRQIHAVSPGGKLLWKFRLSGRPADTLSAGRDGTLYACTLEGLLYAVNPAGRELWRLDCRAEPSGAPAVSADGTVYMALKTGVLYAVSHTGFIRWKTDCGSRIIGSPIIDDGEAIYVGCADGRIISYSPWGSVMWEMNSPDGRLYSGRTAAVHDHVLYTAYGKSLQAASRDGIPLWTEELPAECAGIVVFKNGLFMRMIDGNVQAADFNGRKLWTGEGGGYSSYPVSGEMHLFLIDGSGLVSMDFNGMIEGRGSVDGIRLTQPVIADEILVCGSEQWVASAFRVSDSEGRGWSQEGGGASHSGSSGIGKWHFNESEYLKNMDYLYLREMIRSGSADDKLKAVKEIGNRIAADGADKGERYLLHLLHTALTEGNMRLSLNTSSAGDYPAVRREAARLIGLYGTFESIELLTAVLTEEKQYDVSAAIINALGALGSDYNYLPQWSIYNKVIKDNNGSAYEMLAQAAIEAAGKIIEYSGITGAGYGYRTLMEIYRGNYSSGIRKKAGEVLRGIK